MQQPYFSGSLREHRPRIVSIEVADMEHFLTFTLQCVALSIQLEPLTLEIQWEHHVVVYKFVHRIERKRHPNITTWFSQEAAARCLK